MLRRTVRALAVTAALLASGGIAAAAPQLTPVPSGFRGDDVYVQVRLNDGTPVWMKFDINSTESFVDPTIVGGDAAKAAHMRVNMGGVTLPVYFDVAPKPVGVAPDGKPAAGTLGTDALGDRMVEIDTRARRVFLSPPVDTRVASAGPTRTASR